MADRDLTPAVTDADREAARLLQRYALGGDCYGVSGEFEARMEWSDDGEYVDFDDALKAIARARAEGVEDGRSHTTRLVNEGERKRGFAEGAASERADILALCSHYATAAGCREAIRARGEGGKA